jgi:branched-chain amino acid transport system permease protein
MKPGRTRGFAGAGAVLVVGFFIYRYVLDMGVAAVEAYNPARLWQHRRLGLNSLLAWPVGALFAGLAAWVIGKIALGLREDYLAIATLGIAEIIVTVMRNEDWLARGVKNLIDLPRPWPVPKEVDLQVRPRLPGPVAPWAWIPSPPRRSSSSCLYAVMFGLVLAAGLGLRARAEQPLGPHGPRHPRQRDFLGRDGQGRQVPPPADLHHRLGRGGSGGRDDDLDGGAAGPRLPILPLRFTFLIWVMVIVGGSGNNWGSILGGLLIGWLWLAVEFLGPQMMGYVTAALPAGDLKDPPASTAPQHMRLLTLGVVLLLVLRFAPRGLIPEK